MAGHPNDFPGGTGAHHVSPIPSLGPTREVKTYPSGSLLARLKGRAYACDADIDASVMTEAVAEIERLQAIFPVEAGDVGWRMVPVEPTPEMWRAGERAFDPDPDKHHDTIIGDIYRAMLAASPPLAEGQEQKGGA